MDFINPLMFPRASRLADAALRAAASAVRLKADLAKQGVVAIYANDNYGWWHSDFKDVWKRCAARGGAAGQMAHLLVPTGGDITVLKPRNSAFFATPLEVILRELRCRQLVIAGLVTENCVFFTAMDAYLRGFEIWIPSDCAASTNGQAHQLALNYMADVIKAHVDPAYSS